MHFFKMELAKLEFQNLREESFKNFKSNIQMQGSPLLLGLSEIASVILRPVFLTLNWYGHPNIESNFFTNPRFVKIPQNRPEKAFQIILIQISYLDTLSYTYFSDRIPNHGEGLSVSLRYTGDICTGMPKKTLGKTLIVPLFIFYVLPLDQKYEP